MGCPDIVGIRPSILNPNIPTSVTYAEQNVRGIAFGWDIIGENSSGGLEASNRA